MRSITPMRYRERVGTGFDQLSPVYDFFRRILLGRKLWSFKESELSEQPRVSHLSIVGGGTGEILDLCLRLGMASTYSYVEWSPNMIKRSKRRVGHKPEVSWHERWPENQRTDLVLLPFVLDCHDDDTIQTMLQQYKEAMPAGGTLIYFDFRGRSSGFQPGLFQRGMISLLYLFFRLFTGISAKQLPDYDRILSGSGWQHVKTSTSYQGWVAAGHWRIPAQINRQE